ncbi:hypothetical protein [Streptomyces rubiginosohelvolus]|uniref:hypothetical protein n=1 Tax=Streptomyces rubiginosohelvolus TaxID=67362 RepID=UPI003F4C8DF8
MGPDRTVESEWKLTGGVWVSHDDGQEVSGGGSPDIEHIVPLAEACDFRRVVADQGDIRPAALAEDPAHHARGGMVDVKSSAELLLG